MRITLLTLLLTLSFNAHSFTLTSNNIHKFSNSTVLININDKNCLQESKDILKLAVEATNIYWNKISLTKINFVKGVRTRDTHNESILITCETLHTDDITFASIEGENHFIKINSEKMHVFLGLSKDEKLTLIGHAFGHAIGLGHSQDSNSLMSPFIENGPRKLRRLSYDDIDGMLYLYGK
ncbi:MAG: matrixin family metalloprotease [Bacteriovoracaceae bacterium]|nr:matrixin family metalloprotease [Bacteriovoracaceae bacterium]